MCACDAPKAAGWALRGRRHIKVKMRVSVRRVRKEDRTSFRAADEAARVPPAAY